MAKQIKYASVRWTEGMEFEAASGSGHRLVINAALKAGSTNQGPSPMELVLIALAGCTAMDVIDILKKKRQQVTGLEVRAEGTRAENYPKVYTDIQIIYLVHGKNISSQAVERAIHLSETKYCSVGAMLGKTAKIKTQYEIIPG